MLLLVKEITEGRGGFSKSSLCWRVVTSTTLPTMLNLLAETILTLTNLPIKDSSLGTSTCSNKEGPNY